MKEKTCRTCGETKPVSQFYARKDKKDGYRNDCKDCQNARVKAYRQTEKGRAIEKKAKAKYDKSDKKNAAQKRYRESEKGIAFMAEWRDSSLSCQNPMSKKQVKLISSQNMKRTMRLEARRVPSMAPMKSSMKAKKRPRLSLEERYEFA